MDTDRKGLEWLRCNRVWFKWRILWEPLCFSYFFWKRWVCVFLLSWKRGKPLLPTFCWSFMRWDMLNAFGSGFIVSILVGRETSFAWSLCPKSSCKRRQEAYGSSRSHAVCERTWQSESCHGHHAAQNDSKRCSITSRRCNHSAEGVAKTRGCKELRQCYG